MVTLSSKNEEQLLAACTFLKEVIPEWKKEQVRITGPVAAGVYKKYLADTDDHTPTVIASTASPYKFTRSVMDAVAENTEDMDDFALADRLSEISGVKVPKAVEEIRTAPVLHDTVVDAPDMPDTVKKILGIK